MEYVFPILVVLAMLGALGTLGYGLISMARGGTPQHANKLMRTRIMFQAIAILLFVIFMVLFRHG
ncbi:MAG: twin transmembrane helix small protein [Stellaceae bacterium]